MPFVLVRVSIAVKRHHDHGYSYKGKHLIEVVAYISEVQSIIIMAGIMVHAGRHSTGEVVESPITCGQQEMV